jgi:putative ABC transport system permease protein
MLDQLTQDLSYVLRSTRRNPGLTALCVLTLAVGIGANTAVFSVIEAVLLRPLPYPNAERMVSVRSDLRGFGISDVGMSPLEFEDFRDRAGIFEQITFLWPMDGNLIGGGRPERTEVLTVGPNYFRLLGRDAKLGRTFRDSDIRAGICEPVVLSDYGWHRLFGADPKVIGRKILVDYDSFTIIGVMPADFRHPGTTLQGEIDMWMTGGFGDQLFPRQSHGQRRLVGTIGVLMPGLTLEQAQAKLDVFAAQLRRQYPDDYPTAAVWAPRLRGLQNDLASRGRSVLLILSGTLGLVLLICCATISMLLLVRATGRKREFAMRIALGASRKDLIRQLGVETVLLALTGTVAGLALFSWIPPLLVRVAPLRLPQVNMAGLNWRVFAFIFLTSIVSATLAGMAPALQSSKLDLVTDLKDGGSASGGRSRHRTQSILAQWQIAFSLMLMVGAGLLLKSFWNLAHVDPGFNPNKVVVASLWLSPPMNPAAPQHYFSPEYRKSFAREVLRRVRSIPGVEAAALGAGDSIPLVGWNPGRFGLEDAYVAPEETLTAQMTSVSPDFLEVMGLRLIAGRNFTEADDGGYLVAMIDETMAARFWKDRDPIGKRIRLGTPSKPQWWTIVGVVNSMKTDAFQAPDAPHIFFPLYQRSTLGVSVFLRTSTRPEFLMPVLRRQIEMVDPDLPVFGVRSMKEVVADSMAQNRFALQVIGGFAFVALALAGLGVYGVTAYSVGWRTREIGIRIALGADRGRILGLILRQGFVLTLGGLAFGLLGALALTRFLRAFLFGVTTTDLATYAGISAVLVVATLAACYLPARRAAGVHPMTALRSE